MMYCTSPTKGHHVYDLPVCVSVPQPRVWGDFYRLTSVYYSKFSSLVAMLILHFIQMDKDLHNWWSAQVSTLLEWVTEMDHIKLIASILVRELGTYNQSSQKASHKILECLWELVPICEIRY